MLRNFILTISTCALAFFATVDAKESPPAVVNKSSCSKLINTTKPFILLLNSNDDLLKSITQCAKDAKLVGATVNGLGQLHNPTLAYFTSNPDQKPTLTTFPGYYELASLNGNIAANGEDYYTHAHAVLADKHFKGIAGHVDNAKVGLTAEITIIPFATHVERTVDPRTGFGPLVQGESLHK